MRQFPFESRPEFEPLDQTIHQESYEYHVGLTANKKGHRDIIGILLYLFFLGLLLYSIIQVGANQGEYEEKCGREDGKHFFQFMIVRLVLGILEIVALTCMAFCIGLCMGPCYSILGVETVMKIQAVMPFLFLLAFHSIFLGLGASYTSKIDTSDCKDFLSSISFTKTPLFQILAWVYVGIDALVAFVALIMTFTMIFNVCFLS